jgi:hypothetical protein
MAELNLNRDTVQLVIDKTHEFQAGTDVTFPGDTEASGEQRAGPMASNFDNDPLYQDLKNTIDDLEPDQQVSLVSLMWLGRGDYSISEWGDALRFAEETWTDHTADYLIGTSLLADYLQGGLEQLTTEER